MLSVQWHSLKPYSTHRSKNLYTPAVETEQLNQGLKTLLWFLLFCTGYFWAIWGISTEVAQAVGWEWQCRDAWECWEVGCSKDGYSAAWGSRPTRQLEAVGQHWALFVVLQRRQMSLPLVFSSFNIQPSGTTKNKKCYSEQYLCKQQIKQMPSQDASAVPTSPDQKGRDWARGKKICLVFPPHDIQGSKWI